MEAMRKTTLYLPTEVQRRLKDAAVRSGRPQAEIVRQALEQYLQAERPPLPRSIGTVEDAGLDGRDSEQWLRENWRPG